MPFDPSINHIINLTDASKLTANYRLNSPGQTLAHAFGRRQMLDLLIQNNCEGFRIYYGIDQLGEKQLVIVGVDINGNDLYEGILLDLSQLCPSVCSSNNPLNTI
jgi:hypothetical protein